jgi:hypothetical protein
MTVKDAVRTAAQRFAEVFENVKDFRLEEVEMADDGTYWDITFSMPDLDAFALAAVIATKQPRLYKVGNRVGNRGQTGRTPISP